MNFLRIIWERFFSPRNVGGVRSSKWPATEKAYRKLRPISEISGSKGTLLNPLQVHHKKSFASHPEDELNFANLLTVTREEHYIICHLENWQSLNENIEEDIKIWKEKITTRPKLDKINHIWVYPK